MRLSRCLAVALLLLTQACGLTLLSAKQEIALGLDAYPKAVGDYKEIHSGRDYEMLQKVMHRLTPDADPDVRAWSSTPFAWEVKLLDAPKVANAWCLPGGKMAFYSGILPICNGEDGVAVVMAHEIAHAVKRHSNQRISQDRLIDAVFSAGSIALSDASDAASRERNATILSALGVGVRYGIQLPYSRSHESEADAYGLELMARAGYHLDEAVRLWERMAKRGDGTPEFLSTHPSPSNRAQALRELIPKLLAKYPNAKR